MKLFTTSTKKVSVPQQAYNKTVRESSLGDTDSSGSSSDDDAVVASEAKKHSLHALLATLDTLDDHPFDTTHKNNNVDAALGVMFNDDDNSSCADDDVSQSSAILNLSKEFLHVAEPTPSPKPKPSVEELESERLEI